MEKKGKRLVKHFPIHTFTCKKNVKSFILRVFSISKFCLTFYFLLIETEFLFHFLFFFYFIFILSKSIDIFLPTLACRDIYILKS